MTEAIQTSEAATAQSRWAKRFKLAGIIVINLLLVAVILGLLVATWLPAYVDRHPDLKIGETYAK